MATPGDLYDVIAPLLGISQATVRAHDFSLARAGLRTTGGRGRSAAKMTSRDAATLTIVSMASDSLSDTVATLNDFATLQSKSSWSRAGRRSPIETLSDNHTFLDVFAALIDGVRNKSINVAEHSKEDIRHIFGFGQDRLSIEICLFKPNNTAVVHFIEPGSQRPIRAEDVIEAKWYTAERRAPTSPTINLARTFTIDDRTLYALGRRLEGLELKTERELRDEMTAARSSSRNSLESASRNSCE